MVVIIGRTIGSDWIDVIVIDFYKEKAESILAALESEICASIKKDIA